MIYNTNLLASKYDFTGLSLFYLRDFYLDLFDTEFGDAIRQMDVNVYVRFDPADRPYKVDSNSWLEAKKLDKPKVRLLRSSHKLKIEQPSNALINDSVTETIINAAKKGYKPCDNAKCMSYSKKGWHHMRTQNHPDSDIWLCYGSMSYNQNHLGHLIDSSSGKPLDVGPCPKCDGTGWIEKK